VLVRVVVAIRQVGEHPVDAATREATIAGLVFTAVASEYTKKKRLVVVLMETQAFTAMEMESSRALRSHK
jgi:hypothetical protein